MLETRAAHLTSLLKHFEGVDINCGQDFRMLLDVALNVGIRQCDIARALKTRRSKLSSWANGLSVARARSERERIADAIKGLLAQKLDHTSNLISAPGLEKLERKPPRSHPDMIL
jgi:hypothetical protein